MPVDRPPEGTPSDPGQDILSGKDLAQFSHVAEFNVGQKVQAGLQNAKGLRHLGTFANAARTLHYNAANLFGNRSRKHSVCSDFPVQDARRHHSAFCVRITECLCCYFVNCNPADN